jgi:hypothetical protein
VTLGENPDRLLDPDPGGKRVLKLGHGHRQPLGLAYLDRPVSNAGRAAHGGNSPLRT